MVGRWGAGQSDEKEPGLRGVSPLRSFSCRWEEPAGLQVRPGKGINRTGLPRNHHERGIAVSIFDFHMSRLWQIHRVRDFFRSTAAMFVILPYLQKAWFYGDEPFTSCPYLRRCLVFRITYQSRFLRLQAPLCRFMKDTFQSISAGGESLLQILVWILMVQTIRRLEKSTRFDWFSQMSSAHVPKVASLLQRLSITDVPST